MKVVEVEHGMEESMEAVKIVVEVEEVQEEVRVTVLVLRV